MLYLQVNEDGTAWKVVNELGKDVHGMFDAPLLMGYDKPLTCDQKFEVAKYLSNKLGIPLREIKP